MFFCWMYVLLNSFSSILRQIGGNMISPAMILLLGSLFAIFYYHIVNFKHIKLIYQHCWTQKSNWLVLNICVTVMWVAAVYAPSMIGSSFYMFEFFATLGIVGSFSLFYGSGKLDWSQLIGLLGLLTLLVYMMVINLYDHFTSRESLGILFAVVGGSTAFFYSKVSSDFMKTTKISATQVLAVRFYSTVIVCALISPNTAFANLDIHSVSLIIAIAMFSLIVPLYFAQKGIEKAGAEMYAIICSTIPFITALMEELYYHNVRWQDFTVYTFYCFFVGLPFFVKMFRPALVKSSD